jgi:hypothetical protein
VSITDHIKEMIGLGGTFIETISKWRVSFLHGKMNAAGRKLMSGAADTLLKYFPIYFGHSGGVSHH